LGAYTRGTDPRVDLAINAEPAINALLQQGMKQVLPYDESLASMAQLAGGLGKG
ncbi:MAG: flagellum-specific ATP synthase FliI, partial [Aestuariibacter sp.]|nr:flagellum-specific ATP synthase FliI [Aestuariibacter sp.]